MPKRMRSMRQSWCMLTSVFVVSIGLAGCGDQPSLDNKVVNPPNTVKKDEFKPNVTPTRPAAKAEPL